MNQTSCCENKNPVLLITIVNFIKLEIIKSKYYTMLMASEADEVERWNENAGLRELERCHPY